MNSSLPTATKTPLPKVTSLKDNVVSLMPNVEPVLSVVINFIQRAKDEKDFTLFTNFLF